MEVNTMRRKRARFYKIGVICGLFLFFSSSLFSQITVSVKNVPLKTALKEIEKKNSYKFFYNEDLKVLKKIVSLNVNNESIDVVMGMLLKDSDAGYDKKDGDIIMLVPKKAGTGKARKIKGIVKDNSGEPIIGANVTIKGTSVGSITDLDGNFSLECPSNGRISVSYIGYLSQEVPVNGKDNFNIVLNEDNKTLSEIVVVGYGTQKKVNLTGAVSSINEKSLDSRPITQSSQALAGLASGVTVSMSQGNPGADGARIRVRGQGTFSNAGSDPLVLIDGLSASLDDVNPDNIKSISVLKDAASAAIYGTRAANGVILIETKRGEKGKTHINYNGYLGWQHATEIPEFVDSWDYATMKNEADKNQDKFPTYSEKDIETFRNGTDPDNFPNVNHLKDLITSGSGLQTGHNVSFSGGGEKYSYLLSLGYLHQDGIVAKNSYDKYNVQFNIDNQITKTLHIKADISAYTGVQKEPRSFDNLNTMIGYAVREGSVFAGRKSDGTYGYQDNYCPEGWMDSPSFTNRKSNQFMGGIEFEWNPLQNFYISGKGGYKYYNNYDKDYVSTLIYNANKTYSPNSLTVTNGWNALKTLQALARYSFNTGVHGINVLAGISQEEYKDSWGSSYRMNFPGDELYELEAGSVTGQKASGSGSEWALRSLFGRINYSYKDRYLFEANARYDGTSRFSSKERWGIFPSASAAWRVSEESFIKDNVTWIDNLKLRLSWGKLGNQNIGNYPYQNVINLARNYPFGNSMSSGGAVTSLSTPNISWETTSIADLGLDFTLFQGKLDAIIDIYDKKTTDILYKIATSSVLGMTPSEVNAASVSNKGIEIGLSYREKIGNVNVVISPNFSYTKNKVVSLANGMDKDINSGLFVGESLGAIYGYVDDGLFVDDNDVKTYPTQPYSAQPGFVRYKDISGPDGVPDGKVDATYDRKIIGTTLPKYTYGLTISADYKNFDFSVLFSGMGGNKTRMADYMAFAFCNGGSIQKWQMENRWTAENPDRNAKYVKLTSMAAKDGTVQSSTYWLRDASFLRLKNLQVGYTIPKQLLSKTGINSVRVYFSGQNLCCFKSFYKGWDPELSYSSSSYYPITSTYTFGLNVKF